MIFTSNFCQQIVENALRKYEGPTSSHHDSLMAMYSLYAFAMGPLLRLFLRIALTVVQFHHDFYMRMYTIDACRLLAVY